MGQEAGKVTPHTSQLCLFKEKTGFGFLSFWHAHRETPSCRMEGTFPYAQQRALGSRSLLLGSFPHSGWRSKKSGRNHCIGRVRKVHCILHCANSLPTHARYRQDPKPFHPCTDSCLGEEGCLLNHTSFCQLILPHNSAMLKHINQKYYW